MKSFLLLVVLIAGCSDSPPTQKDRVAPTPLLSKTDDFILRKDYASAIALLKSADIEAEVKSAVKRKDLRWLAVYEIDLAVPGVSDEIFLSLEPKDTWIFAGTSDAIEDVTWQAEATAFAESYNLILKDKTKPSD